MIFIGNVVVNILILAAYLHPSVMTCYGIRGIFVCFLDLMISLSLWFGPRTS